MNYSQIETEALSLVIAVPKFYKMTHGRRFLLQMDNELLLAIFGSRKEKSVYTANHLQ